RRRDGGTVLVVVLGLFLREGVDGLTIEPEAHHHSARSLAPGQASGWDADKKPARRGNQRSAQATSALQGLQVGRHERNGGLIQTDDLEDRPATGSADEEGRVDEGQRRAEAIVRRRWTLDDVPGSGGDLEHEDASRAAARGLRAGDPVTECGTVRARIL